MRPSCRKVAAAVFSRDWFRGRSCRAVSSRLPPCMYRYSRAASADAADRIFFISVCVMVTTAVLYSIAPAVEKLEYLFSQTNLDNEYLRSLLKAVGICYMTGIAADICRDSGEQALASAAELWGRISLVLLTLPMIDSLLALITGVIS